MDGGPLEGSCCPLSNLLTPPIPLPVPHVVVPHAPEKGTAGGKRLRLCLGSHPKASEQQEVAKQAGKRKAMLKAVVVSFFS